MIQYIRLLFLNLHSLFPIGICFGFVSSNSFSLVDLNPSIVVVLIFTLIFSEKEGTLTLVMAGHLRIQHGKGIFDVVIVFDGTLGVGKKVHVVMLVWLIILV